MRTVHEKKSDFFHKQISALPENRKVSRQRLWAALKAGTFEGFPVTIGQDMRYDYEKSYIIQNEFVRCAITFPGRVQSYYTLSVKERDGSIQSKWVCHYDRFYWILIPFLEQSERIAEEYRAFGEETEKAQKMTGITRRAIVSWLEAILSGTGYSYYIKEQENGVTLSVKLPKGAQVDIPVYDKDFREIIPEVLNTIKRCEETVNNCKVKARIVNAWSGQRWKKG